MYDRLIALSRDSVCERRVRKYDIAAHLMNGAYETFQLAR